jgi:GNAT superfamily N-acetyltransferase
MPNESAHVVPLVTLQQMTPEIYEAWVRRTMTEYAAEHVSAGNWQADEAAARAQAEFDQLLPDGLATAGQHLWSIRDSDGTHVGIMWVGPRPRAEKALFIWDVAIEESERGRGLGQAALEALHAWAKEHGYERVGLHVFGANEVARRLYLRTGYVETDVQMEKWL